MKSSIFSRLQPVFIFWHGLALVLPVATLGYVYSRVDSSLFAVLLALWLCSLAALLLAWQHKQHMDNLLQQAGAAAELCL